MEIQKSKSKMSGDKDKRTASGGGFIKKSKFTKEDIKDVK
jgi:hypothetical protein